jgi:hypothetical protein
MMIIMALGGMDIKNFDGTVSPPFLRSKGASANNEQRWGQGSLYGWQRTRHTENQEPTTSKNTSLSLAFSRVRIGRL